MPTAIDVAAYILDRHGPMSTMKLQKLVYYSQAWSLVWDDEPVFSETIEAWANGPVVRELYDAHKGCFKVSSSDFPSASLGSLSEDQRETVEIVLGFYGDKSAQWLSDLTHLESPWRRAREKANLQDGERGNPEISLSDMMEYYSSIPSEEIAEKREA